MTHCAKEIKNRIAIAKEKLLGWKRSGDQKLKKTVESSLNKGAHVCIHLYGVESWTIKLSDTK